MKHTKVITFFFYLVSITLPVLTQAEIVKWVDENGKVHFGDSVPGKYKNKAENVKLKKTTTVESSHIKADIKNRIKRERIQEKAKLRQETQQRTTQSEAHNRQRLLQKIRRDREKDLAAAQKTYELCKKLSRSGTYGQNCVFNFAQEKEHIHNRYKAMSKQLNEM